jgi:16S rRNA (cytosine967-C5)-methyltransferase
MTTARSVALVALERVENGAYSNLVLPPLLRGSGLDARERAFATDLVYGTIRRRRALDFLLAPRSSQALARLEPVVRAALRMGAYQLVDGVAAHAAVGETVTAVATRAPAARGYVNGVLRAVARDGPPWSWPAGDDVAALGVRYSQPDWMVAMLLAQFGPETAGEVLASADTAPAVTLRVNPKRATVEAVEAELVGAGVRIARGTLLSDALVATGLGDVGALAVVQEGRATPQDQASQAIARLVASYASHGPHTGDEPAPAHPRVLDVAAAPGGKATGIAELLGDGALVVAGDVNPSRAGRIRLASGRLGLPGVVPVVADGQRLPFRSDSFDAVLVDAPCTGLGVLRRRPDARWRVDPGAVETLATLQRALLAAAADAVRPGGVLVYAVCTFSDAETIKVDAWAGKHLAGFAALDPPGAPWRPHGRGALLLPSDADTDGMFVLVLQRN